LENRRIKIVPNDSIQFKIGLLRTLITWYGRQSPNPVPNECPPLLRLQLSIWFLHISISRIGWMSMSQKITQGNHFCLKIKFWVYKFEKQISKITKKKNPELFPYFWDFFLENGTLFWAKLKIFVEQQNLIKILFFKKSKRAWFRKVWTNKKMPETLISENLAMNPCGLKAKKLNFHVYTVKALANQIWIFLFEGFNLAHTSSPIHIWSYWNSRIGHQVLANFRFWATSSPI
jgi:hypothetical protein